MSELTPDCALAAFEVADELIRGAEGIEELDEISNTEYWKEYPGLSEAQRELAQKICLQAFLRAIGRA